MNQAILLRLVLAKSLLLRAKSEATNSNDEVALATSLLHLHDSMDNLLGAVTSHLGLFIHANKNSMMQVFELIDKSGKLSLTHKSELQQLNTMRNSVKHDGIPPNPTYVISLVPLITDFCNKTAKSAFGTNLEDVSLTMTIRSAERKKTVDEIEMLVDQQKYKEAMERAAIGLFEVFDSHQWTFNTLGLVLESKKPEDVKIVFPEDKLDRVHLDLVEYGIDPYLYHRFKNLTPAIGYDNLQDKNMIFRHDTLSWHPKNWTLENARFCLQFLTQLILKQQRGYGGYTITHRRVVDTVTFKTDSQIYSDKEGAVIKSIKKGETLEGGLDGYVNGAWEPHAKNDDSAYAYMPIISTNGRPAYVGYYLKKSDISITSEEFYERMNY